MANDRLRDFVTENIGWDHHRDEIGDDEMVTEAIIIYRAVKVDTSEDRLPERAGWVNNVGCSFFMANGILDMVGSQWAHDIEKKLCDSEEEDNGEED